ncbi:deleted in malignant brain tumors 1 -like protein [Labeo rohita]|uniref:Deleted in malignant brain tumors 1-like protein n=1 Tax=Labeo rohita TaxID=84645 RepID=A0A498N5Z9_LABRO|nr:deleted in malignant brain tumors 1 -like protein [Labeo rohita]
MEALTLLLGLLLTAFQANIIGSQSTTDTCNGNCGYFMVSCACDSSCYIHGDCCPDFNDYCAVSTTGTADTTDAYSCRLLLNDNQLARYNRYNCGYNLGSCSCNYDCQYYGNCCPDYDNFPSCMYNCGYYIGSCSCTYDCQYYGNCCPDYSSYCPTQAPPTTFDPNTAALPSCRHNCGYNLGNCSCDYDCQYYGNCCPDYNSYCPLTTDIPVTGYCPSYTTQDPHPHCGGHLYGSGLFSSPNYPYYYHDNAYCVWYLSAQQGQRIFLTFSDVQLERCCNCDYITIYDGSSTGYPQLGKVCFNDTTHQVFHSSSRYMTVVFRSDYSGVSHGFKALFTSSLTADQGRVDCSSDNMVIAIQRSYLNSVGLSPYDLYVDDHVCRPSVSSSEVVFSFPLDTCGTVKEMMNGYVSYTNNVRASQSQSGEITRQSQFLLHVGCRMEPDTMVQILYRAKEIINANITGTGRFNASIAFYTSSSFYYQIYDSPYEVNLNQYLYVQVKLNRPDNSLDLFLDTCVASPNPDDFKDRSYDLLRNGCARDSTYYSYTSGHHYYARFRFQAFKFLRTHAYVFLQCKVIICPDNDYNSRCRRGCLSRRKRSLDSSTYHTNTVILGPIKLKGQRALTEPCDGYMTDWNGEFFSPWYPNNYPDNAQCTWTIHSTGNASVSLTFTDVDLEECCDYIRVYDGPSTLYPILGEIRDYWNQSFKSSNNDLTVFFYSDSSVTRKGFHAYWVFDVGSSNTTYTTAATETISSVPHPECGGHLYGSGLVSSPNYPYYYHDNAYCVWHLTAHQGQRIFLTFADVQLERCCNCDYITVYDGPSTGYQQLGKVCFNDTTHQVFHSSSRYTTVVFRSDYTGVSQGFKALFTSSLTADQGRVDCSSDNMVIVIQRSYLNSLGLSAYDLYVDDHVCRPSISSTEVVFSFPLDTCGTVKEMMNGYVSYTNNVRASQSQSGEITRQSQFLLHVGCRMEPDTMVQIFYKAREIIDANITGIGHFDASIAFYTSSSFYYKIYDSPYEVNLNQPLYVQVELNRHDYSLDLFLDTCVASPNPNNFKDRSYDLLRNGCPIDNTYYSYTNGHQYYAQFSFRAFKFLRTHAYVYLQCKVIICPDNDYNSRCRQGCRNRRKRSLDSTYHTNTVTLGPIKLKGQRPLTANIIGTKKAVFEEPCGDYITDWTDILSSPSYPRNYPDSTRCTWTIHSTGNTNVSLIFLDVDLETCCEYIRVYDGPTTLYPLLGEVRDYRNQSFKSSNNDMTVFFYSDKIEDSMQSGPLLYLSFYSVFHLSFLCEESCSGYMTEWMGEMFSAQYLQNGNYTDNSNCTWTIHSTGNQTVLLTFFDVGLEPCCNYIRVYDGPSTLSPLLGEIREYGNQSFKSSNNYMTVRFYSEYNVISRGFHANWVFVASQSPVPHPECGGHLYGSGLFSSPHYPNYYHDNAYCVWYLTAQQGQRIFLTFADVQLERCCNCDFITVYDGSSTGYPQLGKVCFNDTTHQVFHSSSRYMTVVFRSDYTGVSHGFKALFTSSLTADQGRVDCSSDNMVIVIQRSYLNSLGLSANDLYVDDHVCRPSISSTEVVFSFPLDTCGTIKEMMNGYVSYTNNVRASQSQSGEITRQSQFLLHVGCRMEPDTMVQIFYKAREITNANITGTGRFNASIAFYTSSSFYYQIYDSPYEVNLNQYLYVQVKLNRPDNSLDLFLDTCVASPNLNDFKDRSYDLLRNGCARDSTYYSYTSGYHYYARFRFQAFKFLRTQAYVYLQCKVIICPDNDYNSRCRQGCLSRRKRSLDSSTYHTNTVMLGPIKLKGQRALTGKRLEECCDYIRVYDGPTTLYPLLGEIRDYENKQYNSSNNDLTVLFYSDGSVSRKGFHANWFFVDSNSCKNNCGFSLGTCSCDDSCRDNKNCCYDYNHLPSCMYNCGHDFGICSCAYDCQYYYSCCEDYNSYCSQTTTTMTTTEPTTTYGIIVDEGSCENNCGEMLPICRCDDLCQQYGDCCPDYETPSCMYNCGQDFGICSCAYDCQYYCCEDYDSYCSQTTTTMTTTEPTTTYGIIVDEGSCENNCGEMLPICGCDDLCQQYGDCCPDYETPSCMYNCGQDFGICSCAYDCQYYCCEDYDTGPSCMYNCGYNFGSCSCTSDCQYYGNCCYDFQYFHTPVGGHLYGSGLFSSPNYPNYYNDNTYRVWYLTAQQGQKIFLTFPDVQLERCCNCDYITVYDGSSTGYPQLGKVCFNDTTHQVFHSSSRYMTVAFRSDYSVVSHGFKALFTSSLTEDEGRVDCSSDNMVIVIQRSYLNSLGLSPYDLYVDDHVCRPSISSSEVVFSFPLDTCGTVKEMMNGYVSYTNNVRASQSQSGEITRQSQFLLHVGCRMEPDTMVQIFYRAREIINANITGTGRFSASIAFYTSSSFNQQIYDSPYEVNLNQYLYVQVKLNRPDNSLDLFLDTCVASPNPNDFKDRSYDLLRNGCPRDNTYYSYTSGQHYYAQFRFQAFQFLQTHAYVYLQCKYKPIEIESGNPSLRVVFNDVMGLETGSMRGCPVEDVIKAIRGHVRPGHVFNPGKPLSSKDADYIEKPAISDQAFCLVYVLPANRIQFADDSVLQKMRDIRLQVRPLGKSSFINSVNNAFKGRITSTAQTDRIGGISFTVQYKPFEIETGNSSLRVVFNDVMGLEAGSGKGCPVEDVIEAIHGHVQPDYVFNQGKPLSSEDANYIEDPTISDQAFCLVYVLPANRIQFADDSVLQKMRDIRMQVRPLGLPQVIVLTNVDEACPLVKSDLQKIYTSKKIKEKMEWCSERLGVSMCHIFPVKNYHEEIETNDDMDVVILQALTQMIHVANDNVKERSSQKL